jgi:hypothetical protein
LILYSNNIQRETRANQVTIGQVDVLEETVPLYRSVGNSFLLFIYQSIYLTFISLLGKAFVLSDKKNIGESLETELTTLGKKIYLYLTLFVYISLSINLFLY